MYLGLAREAILKVPLIFLTRPGDTGLWRCRCRLNTRPPPYQSECFVNYAVDCSDVFNSALISSRNLSREAVRGPRQGLSEEERHLVADDVVSRLKQYGDPWRLSEDLPDATGKGFSVSQLAALRSRFAGGVTGVPGRLLFGLQRLLALCAFGLDALGLNRRVARRLLRAFGLAGFLFSPFDIAASLDRAAFGGRAVRAVSRSASAGSAVLARNFSSATFLALAAAC